jgi:predicted amidohydrolase
MTDVPTAPLRLAALQVRAEPGQVATNARRAASGALRAARQGARLVVLPELHLGGYDLPQVRDTAVDADADAAVSDARLAPLTDVAAEKDLTVLLGAAVRRPDGTLTNSLLAVDATGVRVAYDKQHLWHDEATLFTPGATAREVVVDGWRLRLGVCYDMSFPEHARTAALAGAHVYLCPSAFASGNEQRAAVYLAARALENTVFTVFTNPVGGPPQRPCRGGTAVWGPDGRRLATVRGSGGGRLRCDLDPNDLVRVRGFLRMLDECRTA